ncbi:MAG TPA: hypothetical protein VEC36_13175 [Patescibacteria group bacterium]|nr:hypothetical protein [Patescibacteria group bacterium]
MKKIIGLLLFLCAFKTSALEVQIELEELVRESEIIVIADLSKIGKWNDEKYDYGSGVLTVRKAVWGNYKPGDHINFTWKNGRNVACPREEYTDTRGNFNIWILSFDDEGKIITGTNQRVRPLEEEARIDSILKEHPFFIKPQNRLSPENSPIEISLVYRNTHNHPIKIPAISFKNNKLYLNSAYRVHFDGRDILKTNFLKTNDSLQIAPRSEYSVVIPVCEIGEINTKGYHTMTLYEEKYPVGGEYV